MIKQSFLLVLALCFFSSSIFASPKKNKCNAEVVKTVLQGEALKERNLVPSVLELLSKSVTPFHGIRLAESILEQSGFQSLSLDDDFTSLKGKYVINRNDGVLIALNINRPLEEGFSILGAHIDFPTLKVKRQDGKTYKNFLNVAPEVYGGAMLYSWFDRNLSLAGRLNYLNGDNKRVSEIIDYKKPVSIIPSLAIHLHSGVNKEFKINSQQDLNLLFTQVTKKTNLSDIFSKIIDDDIKEILSWDLSFYNTERATIIGEQDEFITSQALDNLSSSFISTLAFTQGKNINSILVLYNYEEIGSKTSYGAQSSLFRLMLQRLYNNPQTMQRGLEKSFFLSCDCGHAVHPNYTGKYDDNQVGVLNSGPLIELAANQNYITDDLAIARIIQMFKDKKIPFQFSTKRNDLASGSTVGPIVATNLAVTGVDLGMPVLGMHSIKETAGVKDIKYLYKLLKAYFSQKI